MTRDEALRHFVCMTRHQALRHFIRYYSRSRRGNAARWLADAHEHRIEALTNGAAYDWEYTATDRAISLRDCAFCLTQARVLRLQAAPLP